MRDITSRAKNSIVAIIDTVVVASPSSVSKVNSRASSTTAQSAQLALLILAGRRETSHVAYVLCTADRYCPRGTTVTPGWSSQLCHIDSTRRRRSRTAESIYLERSRLTPCSGLAGHYLRSIEKADTVSTSVQTVVFKHVARSGHGGNCPKTAFLPLTNLFDNFC